MKVAEMRIRITFQKNEKVTDEYGNHTNEWADYFTCWATAVGQESPSESGQEQEGSATVDVWEITNFTTRYCSELSGVEPDQFRIKAAGRVYDIKQVNPMGFKHTSLKFYCRRERRGHEQTKSDAE